MKRKQIFDTYTNGLTLPAVTPGKSIVEKQDEENAEVTEENGEATDQPNTAAPATAAH